MGEGERDQEQKRKREEQLRILKNSTAGLPKEFSAIMEMFYVFTDQWDSF